MESLSDLKKKAQKMLENAKSIEDLDAFEIEFFGRKQGKLTQVLRSLSTLGEDARRELGAEANILRQDLLEALETKRDEYLRKSLDLQLAKEKIDISFPGKKQNKGHLHPNTLVRRKAEAIFRSMGFSVFSSPDIDTEFYNFDSVNVPKDHPARDMQDTFWVEEVKGWKDRYIPRTHVSNAQVRYMEKHNPPFRIVYSGKVFRNEATDASHDFQFNQIECLMVGENVSVANLKYVLETFFERMLGSGTKIRMRPSFFPFVEPGFEVDITCVACKGKGCSVCKQSGWVELLGAGMVHQNVFKAAGYVPGQYQGFAFGMGLDRITMMKYNIPDIRLLRGNDVRFLEQFSNRL